MVDIAKRRVTLTNWALVLSPEIYQVTDSPGEVFCCFQKDRPVALFGQATRDPRHQPSQGDQFADGHRIITSPILAAVGNQFHTKYSVYMLSRWKINPEYYQWCKANHYDPFSTGKADASPANDLLRHICENCGLEETLSPEEGYKKGWDYPPKMGQFKIVSPRTCGNCTIDTTLWWQLTVLHIPVSELNDRHKATLERILSEPESIAP